MDSSRPVISTRSLRHSRLRQSDENKPFGIPKGSADLASSAVSHPFFPQTGPHKKG
jgi:hypothetical protein